MEAGGRRWSFTPTLDSVRSREASYEFRRALELAALRSHAFAADADVIREQRRRQEALLAAISGRTAVPNVVYETDARFHEAVVAFSGNQFFLGAIAHQNRLRRLLELYDSGNLERVGEWCHEHIAILDAIAAGDRKAAVERMDHHLHKAYLSSPHIGRAAASLIRRSVVRGGWRRRRSPRSACPPAGYGCHSGCG